MNLKGGRQGSIRITTAVPGFNRDLYIQPWPPIEINPPPTNGNGNGGEWGGIGAAIGIGAYMDLRVRETEKDCGASKAGGKRCWDDYNNCVRNCFYSQDPYSFDADDPSSTEYNKDAWER